MLGFPHAAAGAGLTRVRRAAGIRAPWKIPSGEPRLLRAAAPRSHGAAQRHLRGHLGGRRSLKGQRVKAPSLGGLSTGKSLGETAPSGSLRHPMPISGGCWRSHPVWPSIVLVKATVSPVARVPSCAGQPPCRSLALPGGRRPSWICAGLGDLEMTERIQGRSGTCRRAPAGRPHRELLAPTGDATLPPPPTPRLLQCQLQR